MGLFDTVTCEVELPGGATDYELQTKSLSCSMDQLTLTKEGRLILHATKYEPGPDLMIRGKPFPQLKAVEVKDVDLRFHGDLWLVGLEPDGLRDYVARFTHGSLEWIRLLTDIDPEERELLELRR